MRYLFYSQPSGHPGFTLPLQLVNLLNLTSISFLFNLVSIKNLRSKLFWHILYRSNNLLVGHFMISTSLRTFQFACMFTIRVVEIFYYGKLFSNFCGKILVFRRSFY